MEGSDFVFDCAHLLNYKYHKIYFTRGRSYTDSPDWIKSKKATINSINKSGNKCFQYVLTVALNHEKLGKHAERIAKIKTFINKYNLEGINYPSEKNDWKKFEENNSTTALNMLRNNIYPAYISKHNLHLEHQIII